MTDQPTEPVRFFVDDDQRLPQTVASQLKLVRKKKVDELGGGYAQTFEDYKLRVGFIKGLEAAIEICEEAEKEFTGH